MQPITAQLDAAFRKAIATAYQMDADPLIAPSGNEKFGDYQSNAAMGLAKQLAQRGEKVNPRAVAEKIKSHLELGEMAAEISIAGPGFINVRLARPWLEKTIAAIGTDERAGMDRAGRTLRAVVDYSGPNIAKQMHVGHLRSTIIGDAVARVLDFQGHTVIRQNHLGDWGTQFGKVVLAMWYTAVAGGCGRGEALREQMALLAEAGKDKTMQGAVVQAMAALHQELLNADPDGKKYFEPALRTSRLRLEELEAVYQFVSTITDHAEAQRVHIRDPRTHEEHTLAAIPRLITTFIQHPELPQNEQERLAWEKARAVTLETCQAIYQRLDVQLARHELQEEPMERGESFYNPMLADVVRDLRASGVAIESEGAVVVPIEGYEAPLLIEKSRTGEAGGGYLYGTTDLAAIRFRVSVLKADRILYFTDSRQSEHFAKVFAAAKKAGWAGAASLEHAPFGTMLGEDGKPFKTRSGGTVKLAELLDEAEQRALALVRQKAAERNLELDEAQARRVAHAVGVGAVKYADLSKDRTSDYVFSFDKMLSLDGNTAPYLQYAYARIRSIFRKAASEARSTAPAAIQLESPQELSLARHILRLGEVVDIVSRELKPHHLCNYLYELATRFSGFYENCPVLQSEEPLRSSRLALCDLTARALAVGLELLGIEHPEQM